MAREGGADLHVPPRKRAAETAPRKRRTKQSTPKAGSSDRRELRNAVHASTADKARWELMGNGSCQELCLPCWPKFQDGREPVRAAPGQATPATAPKPDATPPADNGDEAADPTMPPGHGTPSAGPRTSAKRKSKTDTPAEGPACKARRLDLSRLDGTLQPHAANLAAPAPQNGRTHEAPGTAPAGRTPSSAELRLEAMRLRILAKQAYATGH